MTMDGLSKAQRVWIALAVSGFIIAGSLHFIRPEPYVSIMPLYLPWHSQVAAYYGLNIASIATAAPGTAVAARECRC
jgi:uncharacterized membrane protein